MYAHWSTSVLDKIPVVSQVKKAVASLIEGSNEDSDDESIDVDLVDDGGFMPDPEDVADVQQLMVGEVTDTATSE